MTLVCEDTIAAISTAVSNSGIGIIRISGPNAVKAAQTVFRSPKGLLNLSKVPSHTIHYGYITDNDGSIIDEVLATVMLAPKTYTAEDVVEINCHGGVIAMKKILDTILHCGISVRAALPGEFTKRAFLNGRIDLSEAEAVMDIIQSKNVYALKNSVNQIRGSLYREITNLRTDILHQMAFIEASLDDPEHMDYFPHIRELSVSVKKWCSRICQLIVSFDSGRFVREGIKTVIAGKTNVGKSSLLNLLAGEDRAIVTDIEGTTRDLLIETVNIQGMTLIITDTAGLRKTEDKIEKIGVERAVKSIQDADLIIWLIDSSSELDENDKEISRLLSGKRVIVLLNKCDLKIIANEEKVQTILPSKQIPVIPFSVTKRIGLQKLKCAVNDMFFNGYIDFNDEIIITNARHKTLLENARDSLYNVEQSINERMSEDLFTVDLMDAYEALGQIIGQEIGDDLADEIFSHFCVGK